MDESKALTILDASEVTILEEMTGYDDGLTLLGMAAELHTQIDHFKDYHESCSENTRIRQKRDLTLFSQFILESSKGKYNRSMESLYQDAMAWKGVNPFLLKEFMKWQQARSYSIGSINVRLATARQYCLLAHKAGVLSEQELRLIQTVKGHSVKDGMKVDRARKNKGIATRNGAKKALPTPITTEQALDLQETTLPTSANSPRAYDRMLDVRDMLMMSLMIELALRVGEVAALNIENFDLQKETLLVVRSKTFTSDVYDLREKDPDKKPEEQEAYQTLIASRAYLATMPSEGPLFVGYEGKRLSTQAIQKRVKQIGEALGINHLSPHDLRHYWTVDAFANGNSLDRIQHGGGWSNHAMPMRYAQKQSTANAGIRISRRTKTA